MDDGAIFILFTLIYFVPAPLLAFWRWRDIRRAMQVHPGRPSDRYFTPRFVSLFFAWISGSAAIILAIIANLELLFAISLWVISIATSLVITAIFQSNVMRRQFDSAALRYWIAASIFWLLLLLCWQLIFGFSEAFIDRKLVLIALLPPMLVLVGYRLFVWAKSPSSGS